jgi:capsid protein
MWRIPSLSGVSKKSTTPPPPKNIYEGGKRFSTRRSTLRSFVRDARFDADQATRTELIRKARYFEKNNAIVNRLADLWEIYTAGSNGLAVVPASSDEVWNLAAADWWNNEFCTMPFIDTRETFACGLAKAARNWFIDGEYFWILTNSPDSGRPRLRGLQSHRVTFGDSFDGSVDTSGMVDGVRIDTKTGRILTYYVADGWDGGKAFPIPEQRVIHLTEPSYPGQLRGITYLHAVMNDIHDLDDLQLLSMDCAKQQAKVSRYIKTQAGEFDAEDLLNASETVTNADGTTFDRKAYYEENLGGEEKALLPGDDVLDLSPDRPNIAEREHWTYLVSKICIGAGMPMQLVLPYSIQGTMGRADLAVAAEFFRARHSVLANSVRRVYEWAITWATKNVRALGDPPIDTFKRVNIRPPKSPDVDVGRNSSAMLNELEAGATTFEAIYGALGEDWRRELRQRAQEAKYLQELAVELGIDVATISKFALNRVAAETGAAAIQSADDDSADIPIKKGAKE